MKLAWAGEAYARTAESVTGWSSPLRKVEKWEKLLISGQMRDAPVSEIFVIRAAFDKVTQDCGGRDMVKDSSVLGRDSAYVVDNNYISTKTLRDCLNYLAFDNIKIARALFKDLGWEISALLEGRGILIPDDSDSREQTGFTVKAWGEGGVEVKIATLAALEGGLLKMLGGMNPEQVSVGELSERAQSSREFD